MGKAQVPATETNQSSTKATGAKLRASRHLRAASLTSRWELDWTRGGLIGRKIKRRNWVRSRNAAGLKIRKPRLRIAGPKIRELKQTGA